MIFDVSPLEIVTLAVVAVFIFGPDKLPKMINEVMGFLRKVREFSDSGKRDIRNELGPGFEEFDFQDLNPKTFVRKQLAAHGDDYGLKEIQDLRHDIAEDAQEAVATVQLATSEAARPTKPHHRTDVARAAE
ncbi:sec-independent translocase [Streptomyces sp. NPDC004533]|uniref:sec-independent translocase n=1 Tax=unclassified Streptomyces TaxID=2593676 RepID=UPI0033AA0B7E